MANIQGRPRLCHDPISLERAFEELLEVRIRHPVATDFQALFGVPFVIDVVRRIGENKICEVASHESFDITDPGCIADEHPVLSEVPEVPRYRSGRLGQFRDGIFVRQTLDGFLGGQQPRKFFFDRRAR